MTFLRYLAPNLVTLASLLFGLLSILASFEGRYYDAAWFVIFSVLTDKLDGFVARLLKAATDFGVQLDSFADFLNFGVAPAVLWFTYLSRAPDLPFESGRGYAVLAVACVVWVLAVTFRLARYNVVEEDPRCRRIFFGIPTTLMGGVLIAFFLTCLKYGTPQMRELAQASFPGPAVGGLVVGETVWKVFPILVLLGAFLMASAVKIPKLGTSKSRVLTVFIFVNVFAGYALGFSRLMPEYLCTIATIWIVASLIWGQVSTEARSLKPPSLFPQQHPPPRMPPRPEDDMIPDEDEAHDEEASPSTGSTA